MRKLLPTIARMPRLRYDGPYHGMHAKTKAAMAPQPQPPYRIFAHYAVALWARAYAAIQQATTTDQYAEPLEHCAFLYQALVTWPIAPHEARHQHALLILVEETMLWAVAHRDRGDVDAAERDLEETYRIVRMETARLFGDASR